MRAIDGAGGSGGSAAGGGSPRIRVIGVKRKGATRQMNGNAKVARQAGACGRMQGLTNGSNRSFHGAGRAVAAYKQGAVAGAWQGRGVLGGRKNVSECLPERGMPVPGCTLEDTTASEYRLGARLIR